jgi:hypothetical protein
MNMFLDRFLFFGGFLFDPLHRLLFNPLHNRLLFNLKKFPSLSRYS